MRVVHEGAGAARLEFIDKGLARRDVGLVESAHAIHAIGQALAMPVDGGALGQAIGDEDAYPVALDHLNGRSGRLSVVAPHVDEKAGRHLAHHGLGHQVEFLDASVHAPRRGPAIQGDDRVVRPAIGRAQWRSRIGAGLRDRLGQGSHGDPADGCGRSGGGHCGGRAGEELAALHISGLVHCWQRALRC
ncbi:hypothetical protein D3C72_1481050 [compost metagenome]